MVRMASHGMASGLTWALLPAACRQTDREVHTEATREACVVLPRYHFCMTYALTHCASSYIRPVMNA